MSLLDINQTQVAAVMAPVINNQGTQATEQTLITVMNSQGTQATAALQANSNALLTTIMNNQGTLADYDDATLQAVMNNQGTLATSSKQDAQTAILGAMLNNQGTLTPVTGGATEITLVRLANDQGTLATSANQAASNALLTVVMNDQGTLATSSYQAVQLELLGLILNSQGTQNTSSLATSANQAQANSSLTVIQNNQGTQATASNQSTEISLLSLILNAQGTQGEGLNALSQQQADTVTTYGPTGTLASARVATLMTTDPNSVSVDAFGRLRVSNADYRFDGQLVYQVNADLWDSAWNSTGTVTYDRKNRMAQLTCAANGTSVMQSHYHVPYTPGRGQLAFVTFAGTAAPAENTYHRVGYFDETNGIFLERTSAGASLTLKSSTDAGSETVLQANWNIDKMDGTGPSGLTLDLTKSQILFIQLQALYIGRVIVGFDIDGVAWPVHQFTHANKFVKPYIGNASLPVRYEVGSTGVNTAQLNPVCASVISEGGGPLIDIPARTFTAGNGATPISVNARRPVLSIRPKAQFNQNQNEGIVLPSDLSIRNSTADIYVEVIRNAVLTGASWTSVDAVNSVCEYDVAATAVSGGQTVFSGYSNVSSGLSTSIKDNLLSRLTIVYSELLQTADTLTIVCTSLGGAASTVAALNWKEIR
jgi:hypothetical protein